MNHAHSTLTYDNMVLYAMDDDRLHTNLALYMMSSDEAFISKVVNIMTNRKYAVEHYGTLLAVTQNSSVTQLFDVGVRYYHAHIEWSKNWLVVTNSLQGDHLFQYIMQLFILLMTNPSEIVIVDIERSYSGGSDEEMLDYVQDTFANISAMYNISIYVDNAPGAILADVRYATLLETNARMIVLYPTASEMFWPREESVAYTEPYLYSLQPINNVINRRRRSDGLHVVRAAITTNFTQHIDQYMVDDLNFDDLDVVIEALAFSVTPRKGLANFLRPGTDLDDMILSTHRISRETAIRVIEKNGDKKNKNL